MKFALGKLQNRSSIITSKLNVYISMKKLNAEQRMDFQDLQEELDALKRIRNACESTENI